MVSQQPTKKDEKDDKDKRKAEGDQPQGNKEERKEERKEGDGKAGEGKLGKGKNVVGKKAVGKKAVGKKSVGKEDGPQMKIRLNPAFIRTNLHLTKKAERIPAGTGLNLTRHQLLLLLRLGKKQRYARAEEVFTDQGHIKRGHINLITPSDAALARAGLTRRNVPRMIDDRPDNRYEKQLKLELKEEARERGEQVSEDEFDDAWDEGLENNEDVVMEEGEDTTKDVGGQKATQGKVNDTPMDLRSPEPAANLEKKKFKVLWRNSIDYHTVAHYIKHNPLKTKDITHSSYVHLNVRTLTFGRLVFGLDRAVRAADHLENRRRFIPCRVYLVYKGLDDVERVVRLVDANSLAGDVLKILNGVLPSKDMMFEVGFEMVADIAAQAIREAWWERY